MKWHEKSLIHCFICPVVLMGQTLLRNYAYFLDNRLFSLAMRPQMNFKEFNIQLVTKGPANRFTAHCHSQPITDRGDDPLKGL